MSHKPIREEEALDTLDMIKYIETIRDFENVTRAANHLYISQPYLSKIIIGIEKDYQTELFDRTGQKMRLTYAGERFLHYLHKIRQIEIEMDQELELIAMNKKGRVHLGVNPAIGSMLIPPIQKEFNKKYANIQIVLHEKDADALETMVASGEIGLAMGYLPLKTRGLSYEPLFSEKIYLVVSEDSGLYNPKIPNGSPLPYPYHILADEPMALLTKPYGMRRVVDAFYDRFHYKQNVVFTTSTIYTAIEVVKNGMGSTFVPQGAMKKVFNDPDLQYFEMDPQKIIGDVVLVYSQTKPLSALDNLLFATIKATWTL